MELVIDVLTWILMLGGCFFAVVGGIGLHRFPDFYTRIHAGGITDTMGAGMVLVSLMLHAGFSLATLKLMMILFFLWVSSPTSAHAVAKAARTAGLEPWTRRLEEPPSNP